MFFAIFLPSFASGQRALVLDYNCRPFGEAFQRVLVIDNRPPNALLGYVKSGVLNRLDQVTFDGNIADSLAKFLMPKDFTRLDERTAVLILNELFMSEKTGSMNEAGTLRLSLRLYLETAPEQYQELLTIDSVYTMKGIDVSQKLLHLLSEKFCAISRIVADGGPDTAATYSFAALHNLDSLEMQSLPMAVSKPVAGIYRSYEEFKINRPAVATQVEIDARRPKEVKVTLVLKDKKGRARRTANLGRGEIYAISDGERMYRSVEGNYYEISKAADGFYYDRPATFANEVNLSTIGFLTAGIAGGIAGGIINDAIRKRYAVYRFKINNRTGRSSPVALIDKRER